MYRERMIYFLQTYFKIQIFYILLETLIAFLNFLSENLTNVLYHKITIIYFSGSIKETLLYRLEVLMFDVYVM